MKKIVCIFLCVSVILALCACGGTTAKEPGVFSVGFGRESIHPSGSIQLAGYGNTNERMSQGTMDKLYSTCVAIRDENGETILMYTNDVIRSITDWTPDLRDAISEATGVAEDKIMISATHTHSGPDIGGAVTAMHPYYTNIFKPGLVAAGKAAVADLAPATVKTGSITVDGMNCVRHYTAADGTVVGDNFGSTKTTTLTGHTTEPDEEMQLIRFVREGDKKDVLMVNWQAHSKVSSNGGTSFGRTNRPLISADYPGWCRSFVEQQEDVLFAYYLGACGNLNPNDAYMHQNENMPEDVQLYSKKLSGYMIDALETLKDTPVPTIQTKMIQFEGDTPSSQKKTMEINAIYMGDISFVTVPYEMFDTNGMEVKDGSPSDITFVLTSANGRFHYMPAEYVWDYTTNDGRLPYEVSACQFVKGTGEQVAQALVSSLNELAGK